MAAYFTRSSTSGPGIVPPSPFNPSSISTNLVPVQDNQYSLGNPGSRWTTAYLTYPPTYRDQSAWYSTNYDTDFIKWIQSSIVSGFWSSSALPVYSNISTTSTNLSFFGGISLPNGRVLMAPNNYPYVGLFNPAKDEYSDMTTPGVSIPPNAFNGGVLAPSGKIVFIPLYSGNICVYTNETTSMSNTFKHNVKTPAFCGGVLDAQGNVVMIPFQSGNICTYNAQANTFSNAAFTGADGTFSGGVLYQVGGSTNVVCVPQTNSNICVFSTQTRTVSNLISSQGNQFSGGVLTSNNVGGYNIVLIPSSGNVCVLTIGPTGATLSNIVTNVPGPRAFCGGCLLPTGNVVMAPFNSSNVGMVDPIKMTYSNSTPVPSNLQFAGATLMKDGRVCFIPGGGTGSNVGILTTITPPQNTEFWLSPYFNKF